jgi:hypothetical protein
MSILFRAAATALAACTTLGLLSAVLSMAEPQRSELLARQQPALKDTVQTQVAQR